MDPLSLAYITTPITVEYVTKLSHFCREGILLGVGSPLLDISAKVGTGYLER